jgi:uncharacterized membrane protein YsdA (DUF1294 family)
MTIELTLFQIQVIMGYLASINLITLIMFGMDKSRAKQGRARISEVNLFLLSFIGGVWGGILGMLMFRHKTRKLRFKAVMALILILHVAGFFLGLFYCSGLELFT